MTRTNAWEYVWVLMCIYLGVCVCVCDCGCMRVCVVVWLCLYVSMCKCVCDVRVYLYKCVRCVCLACFSGSMCAAVHVSKHTHISLVYEERLLCCPWRRTRQPRVKPKRTGFESQRGECRNVGLIVCVCVCSPGESWLESEGHSGERKGGNKRNSEPGHKRTNGRLMRG